MTDKLTRQVSTKQATGSARVFGRAHAVMLWAALAISLCGCTVLDGRYGFSYMNTPNPGDAFVTPATPVPRATGRWSADKPTFVGVALSGGGSRSANFGMAVLAELDTLGLLEQVDAISSVSGGGLTAAWYAVYGREPGWAERGRETIARDFLLPMLGRLARPTNLLAGTFTDWDRTDVLAQLFEDRLFGGKRLTFADLGPLGPRAPAVYFNATDTTGAGTRFVFRDTDFVRTIGSDLSSYPLAWAAASSGAFPGVFNSVTLRRYSLDPRRRHQDGSVGADSRYLHRIDGGTSDNLGVETLMELARQHHVRRFPDNQPATGCLLIVVDSHVPSAAVTESRQSDRRNVASMLLDLNFLDGIDAMLSNRRDQTLLQMGIRKDVALGRFNVEWAPDLWEYKIRPYHRVGRVALEYFHVDGLATTEHVRENVNTLGFAGADQHDVRTFECRTWHVALDDIHSIVPWREHAGQMQPLVLRGSDGQDLAVFAYRAKLARLLSQLATSYRLSGPPNCGTELLQRSVYDAARIAVRQDHVALSNLCPWLVGLGLAHADSCRSEPEPLLRTDLHLLPITQPRDTSEQEQAIDRFVRCPSVEQSPRLH